MECADKTFYTKPLLEYMEALPDPRCGRKTKHNHAEILVCLVIGFLAGIDEELFALGFMEWIGEILDIRGSTITTDAIGTQTEIMKQIIKQERHPGN